MESSEARPPFFETTSTVSMTLFRTGLCLLLAGACAACGGSQQSSTSENENPSPSPGTVVVARYDDTTITQSELDSAYAEAVGGRENAADSSLRAYRRFLDQFVNFRLKVRAARDAGMDTLASVQQDVQHYRAEMARPRILRREVYQPVARTLYERRHQEVDVSHILIRPSSNQDTLDAYRTLQEIADSLDQGVPFPELAIRHSDDPSAQKTGQRGYEGRLGYIRAGQVVEPFEKRMYALDPGEVSDIFRTQYGYHLVKVHDRRTAQPSIQLSHILRRPEGDSAATRHFLDSLRTEIVEGTVPFSSAAQKHSQDRRSGAQGGDLGSVSPQDLPERLRQAVATLDSVGAVSEVVRTRFGYHLLKLTGREEQQSFEEAYADLKEQISDRPRVDRRKTAFAHEVRAEEGTTVDTARILRATAAASVDSLARPLLSQTDSASAPFPRVATLGDSTFTLDQMTRHLTHTDGGAQMTVGALIESFLNEKALQYAAARLTRRDPSLAAEVKKYREGVLLFRYMQDSVWTAAARDTVGLRAAYEQNRDQYRFPERVRTIVLRAPSDSLLEPCETHYVETRSIESTVQRVKKDSLVVADTAFVTSQSAEVYQPVRANEDGAMVGPTARRNEWLLMIRDTKLPPRRKTFAEARSSVLQAYQDTYENTVIRRLRERYDAETFPERLRPPFSDASFAP